jgi:hypothetical protein
MEKMSLFKISNEIEMVMNSVSQNQGEITDLDEQKLLELQTALKTKTDGVVEWVKYQESIILLAKNRIEELKELIDSKENALERFNQYVAKCLDHMVMNKIEGELSTITKRKTAMVVEIYDETELPIEYIKIPEPKPSIQKSEIAKDLKNGKEVPGARLVESKTVSITYK